MKPVALAAWDGIKSTSDLFVPNPDQFCGLTRLNAVIAGSHGA
jgi:hypothetical protein